MAKSKNVYVFAKDADEKTRMTGQRRLILDTIKDAGDITHEDLVAALEKNDDFTTNQPVSKVVTYYAKPLQNDGYITIEKEEEEEEEEEEEDED